MFHHLPQNINFQENKLILMTLMMTLNYSRQYLGTCRVILGLKHPDPLNVIDFLVERHNYLQDQAWKSQETSYVAFDDSMLFPY